jgi:predicted GNAT family acetyltransferase
VVGCALRTPPRKLVVTRMPPSAVAALVVDVATCYDELSAVVGPPTAAREFARHWAERQGCATREGMAQRIYVLTRVIDPARSPAGTLRLAEANDTGLVTSWFECFRRELAIDLPGARDDMAARIAAGDIALWYDEMPRALAGVAGRSPNAVRVGPVYTPPEWRGRGYASAVVAAWSRRQLEQGARYCTLYTDLSNPTSNAIYQRIGYEPLCDAIDMVFGPRA